MLVVLPFRHCHNNDVPPAESPVFSLSNLARIPPTKEDLLGAVYIKCTNEHAKSQPEVLTPSPLPVLFQLFLPMKEIIAIFDLSLGMKKKNKWKLG